MTVLSLTQSENVCVLYYEVTMGGLALGLSDPVKGPIMRGCEHGNEPCNSRKDE